MIPFMERSVMLQGVSCCMRFVSVEELHTVLHRILRITKANDTNVTPVTR